MIIFIDDLIFIIIFNFLMKNIFVKINDILLKIKLNLKILKN